jgi:hypothetical protein
MTPRWRIALPIALLCSATVWWVGSTASTPPPDADEATTRADAPDPGTPSPAASGTRRGAPFSAAGLAERQAGLVLWQQRLQRAQQTLASYQESTRYPFDSRPAREHADQWLTHQIITNDLPLRMPGTAVAPNLRVHTTQERVFASAGDSVALTVTATDDNGNVLPLRILSAVAHGATQAGGQAPVAQQAFVDDGTQGDAQAGDGVFSTRLIPASEGFATYAGLIRTELVVQSGEQQGYVAFDVVYTPQAPATWTGPVREALDKGSLALYLAADVAQAGRYVVTGRVDDADGKPFAYVSFNDELGAGAQEVVLTVYGRLVRDQKPAFPLTLHDVDGFLLKADAYPDRALLAARDGTVYTTRKYGLAQFTDAAWSSDETARYVAEYGNDVAQAQRQVTRLQAPSGP